MSASVRVARASDVDDIARLTSQLGYDVAVSALQARLARILARPDQRFFMAEYDGRSVGWLHAAVWEFIEADKFVVIGGLVVDRHHRKHGVGRLLMEQAEQWARDQACPIVRLWSSSNRTEAHTFYERLGYTHVKTQYAFGKAIEPAGRDALSRIVPRVER